ncbi:MAG: hypothetical protein HN348_34935 [Proteobacteria bacterium]|nr:hypothetical protein [Pseudomonadota bacterium]
MSHTDGLLWGTLRFHSDAEPTVLSGDSYSSGSHLQYVDISGAGDSGLTTAASMLLVEDTKVHDCEGIDGGGIDVRGGALELREVEVNSNHASGDGGGIFTQGDLDLFYCHVDDNHAGHYGGGISQRSGELTMTGGRLFGNDLPACLDNDGRKGAGLYLSGFAAQLESVTVRSNGIDGDGSTCTSGTMAGAGIWSDVQSLIVSNKVIRDGNVQGLAFKLY